MRFRHTILCLAVILSCVTHGSEMARGQSATLIEANKRAITLSQQGRHAEAIQYATEALRMGEKELGPDHPTTAILINNLADFYRLQAHYTTLVRFGRIWRHGSIAVIGSVRNSLRI